MCVSKNQPVLSQPPAAAAAAAAAAAIVNAIASVNAGCADVRTCIIFAVAPKQRSIKPSGAWWRAWQGPLGVHSAGSSSWSSVRIIIHLATLPMSASQTFNDQPRVCVSVCQLLQENAFASHPEES